MYEVGVIRGWERNATSKEAKLPRRNIPPIFLPASSLPISQLCRTNVPDMTFYSPPSSIRLHNEPSAETSRLLLLTKFSTFDADKICQSQSGLQKEHTGTIRFEISRFILTLLIYYFYCLTLFRHSFELRQCKKTNKNNYYRRRHSMTPSINYQGDDVEKTEGPADFERAIKLTGYGKFNYFLLLAILPAGCASIYSSTSMSYVLSSAECDLSLTLFDKGLLNSMPFAGMIVTSFFWGFMTDTFGRKKILMYGYLMTSIVSLSSSLSQTSAMLIFFKFLNGVVISGPFSALMSYLAEVHGEQQRSRIYMWLGIFYSIAHITMPCLAWLIIPQTWQWNISGGTFRVTSWRIFLAVCAIPEVSAFMALSWFPESPRFLLSKGRDQEALEVFRRIYSLNSGKEPHTYPVKSLANEVFVKDKNKSLMESLSGGWQQIKPLFNSHYVFRLITIGAIQFGGTVGSNSLRLWMPQLFAIIETYEMNHPIKTSGPFPSICVMIDQSRKNEYHVEKTLSKNHTVQLSGVCAPAVLNSTVYINSIVIALTGVIGYTLAGTMINAVGKKKLMVFCFLSAGLCCGVLYWAEDSNGILGISAVFVALSSIGGAAVINIIVDNFPTCLRTMAISITMMSGRFGAVAGNLLFPVLFKAGCLGPFVMIGIACLICSVLVFFIPQKDTSEEIPEK